MVLHVHVVLIVLVDTNDCGGSLCRFPECSSHDPGSGDVPHPSGDCVRPHHTTGCQSLHVQLPADPHRPVPTPVRERSADHHHPHTCQSGRKLAGKKNATLCPDSSFNMNDLPWIYFSRQSVTNLIYKQESKTFYIYLSLIKISLLLLSSSGSDRHRK